MSSRLLRLAPAGLTLALSAALFAPALGFTLTGKNLPLSERDVRLFDNFSDPQASDSGATHPNFPGATGAELAVWKAVVEWGSRPHGDGTGDPTQLELGSGGANFDFAWQGLATGPGGPSDNVIAAGSGLPPGILSQTEFSAGPGWRITLSEPGYVWDDDPVMLTGGADADIQGVVTIALGFAAGLGLSSVPGATMQASGVLPSQMISKRSIEADDVAGLQAIYGAAAPTKPVLNGALLDATGKLTLAGRNFAPSFGEVWYTPATPGSLDVPVKSFLVASTAGGTLIRVTPPAPAGAGDVLVKGAGSGNASLSNAAPFDPSGAFPSCGAAAYGEGLGGANLASLAEVGPLPPSVGGTLSVSLSGFTASGVASLALSLGPAELPVLGGTVLIDVTKIVAQVPVAVTAGSGSAAVPVVSNPAAAGLALFGQAAMLDPGAPAGVAFSSGLAIVICP